MTSGDWVLLFDMYQMIFWLVTYIECIRQGIRQKTYCMPLFALAMNIAWEALSFVDGLMHAAEMPIMLIYTSWLLLDIGVVYTFFRYGKEETKLQYKKWINTERVIDWKSVHSVRGIFCIAVVGMVLGVMYQYVDNWKLYFSFTDNLLMSGLFIGMYLARRGNRGQSLSIAITKCIGTVCATITCAISFSVYAVAIGTVCLLLDVYYIYLLSNKIKVYEKD